MHYNYKNEVILKGIIRSDFEYSHEIMGEKFFKCFIEVQRRAKGKDLIPLVFSAYIIDVRKSLAETLVEIKGEFRSCDKTDGTVEMFVLVKELYCYDNDIEDYNDNNIIELTGVVCSIPKRRTEVMKKKTATGKLEEIKRKITVLKVAVNGKEGEEPYSSYIPCIVRKKDEAYYALNLRVGDNISLVGMIQSREYKKNISRNKAEIKPTYGVMVTEMK